MGGMNDFNIDDTLKYEYFTKLMPDISIFDVIEQKYYNETQSNNEDITALDEGIYFYKPNGIEKSLSKFNVYRCLIKIKQGTSLPLSSGESNSIVSYKVLTIDRFDYYILIKNSYENTIQFSSLANTYEIAGVVF